MAIKITKHLTTEEMTAQKSTLMTDNQQVYNAIKSKQPGEGLVIEVEGDRKKTVHALRVYFSKLRDLKVHVSAPKDQQKVVWVERLS